MGPVWQVLAREAGLAAEHLAIGVSTLSKSNYAYNANYFQAFFDLSIGFEHAAKLAIIVEYYLVNNQTFPTNGILKNEYGHDIKILLEKIDKTAESQNKPYRLPCSPIHQGIIQTLSEFAKKTRYYNLDYLTSENYALKSDDPLNAWYNNVIVPILKLHYNKSQRAKHIQNATTIDSMMNGCASVIHHAEDGSFINNVFVASLDATKAEFAIPYSRMYIMQIMRFISLVFSDLSFSAMELSNKEIPYFSEFFAIFNNDDSYFKRRKTWSIYKL
jgi:hypothetical protein